jgi:hypothetical protein
MHKALYLVATVISLMLTANPATAQEFLFFNAHTGLCLGPQNGSSAQGTPIVQESCTGATE